MLEIITSHDWNSDWTKMVNSLLKNLFVNFFEFIKWFNSIYDLESRQIKSSHEFLGILWVYFVPNIRYVTKIYLSWIFDGRSVTQSIHCNIQYLTYCNYNRYRYLNWWKWAWRNIIATIRFCNHFRFIVFAKLNWAYSLPKPVYSARW